MLRKSATRFSEAIMLALERVRSPIESGSGESLGKKEGRPEAAFNVVTKAECF